MCAEVSIDIQGASYVSAQQQAQLVWANHQKDGCSKQCVIKVAEVVQDRVLDHTGTGCGGGLAQISEGSLPAVRLLSDIHGTHATFQVFWEGSPPTPVLCPLPHIPKYMIGLCSDRKQRGGSPPA